MFQLATVHAHVIRYHYIRVCVYMYVCVCVCVCELMYIDIKQIP